MVTRSAIVTIEDVQAWVVERAKVAAVYEESGKRLAELDAKLDALSHFLPEGTLEALLKPKFAPNPRPRVEWPFTDLVLDALASWTGGMTPSNIRAKLSEDPIVAERVTRSINGVSNALSRLLAKGEVIKVGNRYYHPDVHALIQGGEVAEEQVANEAKPSFNSWMHDVTRRLGKAFTASDAISAAKAERYGSETLETQPSRVYSWLSRELYRKKLVKDGDYYRHPDDENGAPNGDATGAPETGRVAAPPIESQPALRLIG
jgi:hypothetical protein